MLSEVGKQLNIRKEQQNTRLLAPSSLRVTCLLSLSSYPGEQSWASPTVHEAVCTVTPGGKGAICLGPPQRSCELGWEPWQAWWHFRRRRSGSSKSRSSEARELKGRWSVVWSGWRSVYGREVWKSKPGPDPSVPAAGKGGNQWLASVRFYFEEV